MNKSFNIGRIFGIQFRLHVSWFIIFAIVTGFQVYPHFGHLSVWLAGLAVSLLIFISVLAHELAHSLVGRAHGIPVTDITLFIFGGVARMTEEPKRPSAEFKMALAGPLSSLVICGVFTFLWWLVKSPETVSYMFLNLAIMNGILAAFNLIPGFPLDGGRVFRATLWHFTRNYYRASRIAIRAGQGAGYLMMAGGIIVAFVRPFNLGWFDGIWIMFIGVFLEGIATVSFRQMLEQERKESAPNVEPVGGNE